MSTSILTSPSKSTLSLCSVMVIASIALPWSVGPRRFNSVVIIVVTMMSMTEYLFLPMYLSSLPRVALMFFGFSRIIALGPPGPPGPFEPFFFIISRSSSAVGSPFFSFFGLSGIGGIFSGMFFFMFSAIYLTSARLHLG